jgi:hypothetical protein
MHKRLSEPNVASVLTRRVAAIVACPVPSVTRVHEDVHERTGQEKEPWQEWHDVRPMLGHEEIAGDRQKPEHHETRARGGEGARLVLMVVVFHFALIAFELKIGLPSG